MYKTSAGQLLLVPSYSFPSEIGNVHLPRIAVEASIVGVIEVTLTGTGTLEGAEMMLLLDLVSVGVDCVWWTPADTIGTASTSQ